MYSDSIAGLVVLYNPPKNILDNIKSYIDDVGILYVIDNSEEVDKNLVNELQTIPKLIYSSEDENMGIAYALNKAANRAVCEGYRYLLTMDQDSYVDKDMIKLMIQNTLDESNIGIIAPDYIDKFHTNKSSYEDKQYLTSEKTSGNLLSLEAFKKNGKFNEDYFIDYVDIEYGFRLSINNWKIIKIHSAKLFHAEGELSTKSFFFRKVYPYNYPPVRYYYRTRNLLFLRDKYKSNLPAAVKNEIKVYLKNVLKVFLYEKNKFEKLKMIIKGFQDYNRKKVGKYS